MAGTAKTSKLWRVAAPAPDPPTPNFFVTGLTLHDGASTGTWVPNVMNSVIHGRHAFSNQGGPDGRIPFTTNVKIYETLIEVQRHTGTQCKIQLTNRDLWTVYHTFDSGHRPAGTGDFWHLVHDPPIEFLVVSDQILITRVWINGDFHRLSALHIGTRS